MKTKLSHRRKIEYVELPCRKATYNSLAESLEMIHYINETRVTRKIQPYKCPVCGLWHLTSKPGK
jgi:hypothetical protein